jgi:hypothetical protein
MRALCWLPGSRLLARNVFRFKRDSVAISRFDVIPLGQVKQQQLQATWQPQQPKPG